LKQVDVLVIGAGAAGLMCGAQAGYRGRSVLIVDHAPKAAAKIRISGGGKCNFTNLHVTPEHYICGNPHFVKSALASYTSQDFIELMDRHNVVYEQRELGKLFCIDSSGEVIQALRTECDWAGNEIWLKTRIERVRKQPQGFVVETLNEQVCAQSLVVATGGLSFPKLMASDLGYRLAQQFGLSVTQKFPGLVPFTLAGHWQRFCHDLAGVSLDAAVSVSPI